MRKILLILLLLSAPLPAAEFRPYPEAAISIEQWQTYFDAVRLEFGETMQEEPEVNLVLFHDESTATYYAFTIPANPAHPAWVTRRVVEQDGEVAVEQTGYFAGDEAPFADLFDAFSDLSDELGEEFKNE
ncbi:MAG: hypothetical protein O2907_05375 [Proteobacteria bacterium]|nr:hypothetical protein [Pseudomonadota bacterium]MDA1063754.1 hypothetical protein [Pseudomonadota bacterium]